MELTVMVYSEKCQQDVQELIWAVEQVKIQACDIQEPKEQIQQANTDAPCLRLAFEYEPGIMLIRKQ